MIEVKIHPIYETKKNLILGKTKKRLHSNIHILFHNNYCIINLVIRCMRGRGVYNMISPVIIIMR